MHNSVQLIKITDEMQTINIMRKLSEATRCLAELKGLSNVIPNPEVLISFIFLSEAMGSSAVENIVTTED